MHPSTNSPEIDNDDMLALGRRGQLVANVTYLMLKGAGLAAAALLLIWLSLWALSAIGDLILPEDRLFTPDPTPLSHVTEAAEIAVVV